MRAKHLILAALACAGLASPAAAGTIIDEWSSIQVPPPPKLEDVTVDPKTTALLVLDLVKQSCNEQVRPRCVASLAPVAKLLKGARDSKTTVIFSLYTGRTADDILPQVKPEKDEPLVVSLADKFIDTDLEKMLKDKGIKTVIVVGTAANAAVLYTASHAVLLGFNAVVPVDGMSDQPYSEQLTAWNLTHASTIAGKVKLTTVDMLKF